MNRQEAKTGQRIDVLKQSLISPALTGQILRIPDLPYTLSIIDLGSGDASSSQDLLVALLGRGRRIQNLAVIDADIGIFPDLVGTVTSEPVNLLDTQVVQAHSSVVVAEFLNQYEEKYDVALSQLVLHQIENIHEGSYLMYLAYRALKSTGDLFVVNLHPHYLQYLMENEPNKFTGVEKTHGLVTGTYRFDSSGSTPVYSRSIENQLAMFLGLGFDFVGIQPLYTDTLVEQKARYRDLAEKHIPMFYSMHVRKNPTNFISSTEGTIKHIKPYNEQWIIVKFLDGQEVRIPGINNWTSIKQGDRMVLQETTQKGIDATLLNYWILHPDEEITGGQLMCRRQNS